MPRRNPVNFGVLSFPVGAKQSLIETLLAQQHDPNRPEDMLKVDADRDRVGGDFAADTLRYLIATKARQVVEQKLVWL